MNESLTAKAVKQAIRHLRRRGADGPLPVNQLETLLADRDAAVVALQAALRRARSREVAPAIRLASLIGVAELADVIADVALRRPAPLAAKMEAVDALRGAGIAVPAAVEETLQLARGFVAEPDPASLERILALPPAWRVPVLEEWLAGGRPDVHMLERALGVDPELEGRILARLGESGQAAAVPLLRRLAAEGSDKERQKAAKRALHRLRSAGVVIDEQVEQEGFSLALDTDPGRDTRAWITGIDGAGGRIVWVMTPSATGGERLLEAVVDDEHGVRKAELMAVTRRGFRNHLAGLAANPGILIVSCSPAEVAAILWRAAERTAACGDEPPADFRRWHAEIGSRLPLDTPAAQEGAAGTAIDGDAIAHDRDLLRESAQLLQRDFFAGWAVLGEEVERAARAVRTAETSRLALDDQQRTRQIDEAIAGAAAALDGPARARYRERLEDMAEVLWKARHEGDARLALAAAAGFTEVGDLYAAHPFARALVQRGVLAAYQHVREQELPAGGDRIPRREIR